MTTPYNARHALGRNAEADIHIIKDPGADGVIHVTPVALGVVILNTTGARTLQPAAQVPVGTKVFVVSTANTPTVNTVALAAGAYAEFRVALNASGVPVWVVFGLTSAEQATFNALPADFDGTPATTPSSATHVIDFTETNAGTLAAQIGEVVIHLSNVLRDAGIMTPGVGRVDP